MSDQIFVTMFDADGLLRLVKVRNLTSLGFVDKNADGRAARASKLRPLLLKEMEETNSWARLGAQLYLAWFTVMLAVNGVGIAWLFPKGAHTGTVAPLIFVIFITFNFLGMLAGVVFHRHMLNCDQRIRELLIYVTPDPAAGEPYVTPRSPVPRRAINKIFTFTDIGLVLFLVAWTGLAIYA